MAFLRRTAGGIEVVRLDCTGKSFPRHSHDEFVLGANIVGREKIWIDGRNYEASIQEATLYNPGELQMASSASPSWQFFSIYVQPEVLAGAGRHGRLPCFSSPVVTDPALAGRIRILCAAALASQLTDCELHEGVISLAIADIGEAAARRTCAIARRTAERLLDGIAAPPSLARLAQAEQLTPVQLVRRFSAAYGMPPFAWLNMQRLARARRAIVHGARLADLAAELGFADQAHFTRRFKAAFSVTPGLWQASGLTR